MNDSNTREHLGTANLYTLIMLYRNSKTIRIDKSIGYKDSIYIFNYLFLCHMRRHSLTPVRNSGY